VGVGRILLETEPHPARNSKRPVKRMKERVRTKSSLEPELSVKKGNVSIDRRAAAQGRLSRKTALTRSSKGSQRNPAFLPFDSF
jgi:hypothetical protein